MKGWNVNEFLTGLTGLPPFPLSREVGEFESDETT